MNLRDIAVAVSAVVGLTVTMAAQGAVPASKAPPKVKAKSVTITGCVAQGVDADHYVLANAIRREQPPASSAVAGASKEVRSDKSAADDRLGPYDLQGAEFKAHLGHMVEVTGTSGTTGKSTGTPSAGPNERQPLPKFNVQSVKMISATCSAS